MLDVVFVFVLIDCEVCAAGATVCKVAADPCEGTSRAFWEEVVFPVFAFFLCGC